MMTAPFQIKVKHGKNVYDVPFDPAGRAIDFKQSVATLTNVPVDRLKIIIKGSILADTADLSTVKVTQGQTVVALGSAQALPPPPEKPVVFLEDMTPEQQALVAREPIGLTNMGNTCYLNSSIQILNSIPELRDALIAQRAPAPADDIDLPTRVLATLKVLVKNLHSSPETYTPFPFVLALRQYNPQFAERDRSGKGSFSQQDAQELWATVLQAIKGKVPVGTENQADFVESYMTGQVQKTLQSVEAPDEPATTLQEPFLELKCDISGSTNHLIDGMRDSLNQKVEKESPSLGRSAVYTSTERVSRMPKYLSVNLVRFFWRREIQKKTKIMRQVVFPFELDIAPLLTDDLKAKIQPLNDQLLQTDKDRRDRAKVRAKANKGAADLPDEEEVRATELAALKALVPEDIANDTGSNPSSLYELVGIVSHKGASADGGHYVAWARMPENDASEESKDPDKREWYKFDDEKVTVVPRDKITALSGGGEDHVAYIMLYAAKSLE